MTPPYQSLPDGSKRCKRGHAYDGKRQQCPTCQAAMHAMYVQNNHDALKRYYAEYDKRREPQRKIVRQTREYKDRDNDNHKARRRINPEETRRRGREYQRKNAERCIWQSMLARCLKPTSLSYQRYGGRGITVCKRWQKSFDKFLSDMGPRPSSKHSIERIDNNKGYSPKNCCWATKREQSRNTRRTRMLTFNGKTQCMTDWASELGLTISVIYTRITALHWTIEKTLSTPVRRHPK